MAVADGYQALHRGSLFFDRTDRRRMRVSGEKAAELINGMVTADVGSLSAGHARYAAALTAKGKIVADLRILCVPSGLLIDSNEAAAPGWREMVAKYVNPRVAPYTDVTAETSNFAVAGPASAAAIGSATGIPADTLRNLDPYEHVTCNFGGDQARVMKSPEIPAECFDVFLPSASADRMRAALAHAGAAQGSLDLWHVLRVEAGRPEWGIDMDSTTLPQEALLDELGAISFTKGCYIGQETVARIHFRGHVNRLLRKLRFVTSALPPRGANVVDDAGVVVGDVRSTALSPRLGGIALGMIRREVELGSTLHARWAGGEASVQIEGEKKGATA